MAFLKLKCESCGAVLTYDKDKNIAFCPYCGNKYLKQESINNNYNNFSGATIYNINDDTSNNKYIETAEIFYKEKNFSGAIEMFKKAKEINPQDYRAWWGMARSYERVVLPLENKVSGEYYSNAISLCKSEVERKKIEADLKAFYDTIHQFIEMESQVRHQLLVEEAKEAEENRKRQNKKYLKRIIIIYFCIFVLILSFAIYVCGADGLFGTIIGSAIIAAIIFIYLYIKFCFMFGK